MLSDAILWTLGSGCRIDIGGCKWLFTESEPASESSRPMERIPAPSGSVCAMATFSFPVWHRSGLADNYCSFGNTVIRLDSRTLPQNTAENDDFSNILTRHNEPNPVRNE